MLRTSHDGRIARRVFAGVAITALSLGVACDSDDDEAATTTTEAPTEESAAGVPGEGGVGNPASAHCEENGGVSETREDADGGQYGMCVFEDGSECDEWEFFRDECAPGDNPAEG